MVTVTTITTTVTTPVTTTVKGVNAVVLARRKEKGLSFVSFLIK